jgi:hypothetical protein
MLLSVRISRLVEWPSVVQNALGDRKAPAPPTNDLSYVMRRSWTGRRLGQTFCCYMDVTLGEFRMTKQVPKKAITDLVAQVMRIQKKYAHEQVGVRNDRRSEVKKIINRVASELENKDGN